MDVPRAPVRRRLPLGLAAGGVMFLVVGTSVIFAGAPVWGITLVGTSVLSLVGAVVALFR